MHAAKVKKHPVLNYFYPDHSFINVSTWLSLFICMLIVVYLLV